MWAMMPPEVDPDVQTLFLEHLAGIIHSLSEFGVECFDAHSGEVGLAHLMLLMTTNDSKGKVKVTCAADVSTFE